MQMQVQKLKAVVRPVWLAAAAIAVTMTCLVSGAALANHDDTSIRGLVVSVTSQSDNDVTVDVSGRGYDSSSLPSARLGSQFFLNFTSTPAIDRWTSGAPPALDWGDGSTIANTGIPFPMTTMSYSTGTGLRSFSGQFMHTYAAPGNYTIRAFAPNVYGYYYSSAVSGNVFSAVSPVVAHNSGAYTSVYFSGTGGIGVTNTAAVSVTNVAGGGGGGGSGSSGPPVAGAPVRSGDCGLIGIEMLALYPVWAIARRKKRGTSA